jgi:hypothetical protein
MQVERELIGNSSNLRQRRRRARGTGASQIRNQIGVPLAKRRKAGEGVSNLLTM